MNFELPELTAETPQGVLCQVKVGKLKPTQNAIGFDEVNDKIARYSAKSEENLQDYLPAYPVPVVIGNNGQFHLTDHHHLANALWKTAQGNNEARLNANNVRVVVMVQHNRTGLKGYHFWKAMHEARLVYLFDNSGGGPDPSDGPPRPHQGSGQRSLPEPRLGGAHAIRLCQEPARLRRVPLGRLLPYPHRHRRLDSQGQDPRGGCPDRQSHAGAQE